MKKELKESSHDNSLTAYRVVTWHYGSMCMANFDTLEEAENFMDDVDNCFPECIIDSNDVIIKENFDNVVGVEHKSRVGEIYPFIKGQEECIHQIN